MTYQADIAVPSEILEQIASGDWEVPPELIRIVVNATHAPRAPAASPGLDRIQIVLTEP